MSSTQPPPPPGDEPEEPEPPAYAPPPPPPPDDQPYPPPPPPPPDDQPHPPPDDQPYPPPPPPVGEPYPPPSPASGDTYPPPPGGQAYPPPPPPAGGYPGGGYPPGPGGYPAPEGYQQPFSVGDAFSYGWRKFQANVGPILLAALAYLAVIAVVQILVYAIFRGARDEGVLAQLVVNVIGSFVFTVLSAVMQAGIARGVLAIADGRPFDVSTMFKFDNVVTVIVAGLIVGVASGIGFILCFIPGLVVLFFSQFYVWFIVDRQMGAVDAIKASFSLVNQNVGSMIGFFLASIAAYIVGAILCLVGLLVAVPVIYIAQGYAYRRLQGEPVAA